MEARCFFTGHRTLSDDFNLERAYSALKLLRKKYSVSTFVCGGAIGFDMIMGELVLKLKEEHDDIKLWLFLPCLDQDRKWSSEDKARRQALIDKADYVDCPKVYYDSTVMRTRNYKMVDMCSYGICYFNGKKVSGTAQTLRYARKCGRGVLNLAKEGNEILKTL